MQRLLVFLVIIILTASITWAIPRQQEKEATLRLNRMETEALYGIVDDAAVPGQVRKPLLQKIEVAYRTAFAQPAPVKDTTTKPKKQ